MFHSYIVKGSSSCYGYVVLSYNSLRVWKSNHVFLSFLFPPLLCPASPGVGVVHQQRCSEGNAYQVECNLGSLYRITKNFRETSCSRISRKKLLERRDSMRVWLEQRKNVAKNFCNTLKSVKFVKVFVVKVFSYTVV